LIMPLQLIPTDSILPDIMSFVERAEPWCLIVGSRNLPEEKPGGQRICKPVLQFLGSDLFRVSLPDTQSGLWLIRSDLWDHHTQNMNLSWKCWSGLRERDSTREYSHGVFYPNKRNGLVFRPFDFVRISILNTVCVLIALFYVKPFSFVRYLRKENIRDFLKRNVLQTGESVEKLTLSVMFGVFMGIIPIWGYQLITAIALAYLLRLNKLIVSCRQYSIFHLQQVSCI
jgi:hypothetical protein